MRINNMRAKSIMSQWWIDWILLWIDGWKVKKDYEVIIGLITMKSPYTFNNKIQKLFWTVYYVSISKTSMK